MQTIKKVMGFGGNWAATIAMLLTGILIGSAYIKHMLTDNETIYAFRALTENGQIREGAFTFLLIIIAAAAPLLSLMAAIKVKVFLESRSKSENKGAIQ